MSISHKIDQNMKLKEGINPIEQIGHALETIIDLVKKVINVLSIFTSLYYKKIFHRILLELLTVNTV